MFVPFVGKITGVKVDDCPYKWLCAGSIGLFNGKVKRVEIVGCATHPTDDGSDIRSIVSEVDSEGSRFGEAQFQLNAVEDVRWHGC